MNDEFVLVMDHISKSFAGVQALDDVSLKIRKGTVHALMGENGAGKSTLMKCLFGIYSPDAGEIHIEGKKVEIHNPRQALNHGISMIQQELHPILHRSVMENIWLGRYPEKGFGPFKFIDEKKMERDTIALLERLKIDLNVHTWTVDLSASECQSMEIAIAVSYNSKIIVMDEPTSSLTENEVARLFDIINHLRDNGVAIIYISHKMEEILTISDYVTIMRDGKHIGTYPAPTLTIDEIVSKMVGRDLSGRYPAQEILTDADVLLKVEHLTSAETQSFQDISFSLKKGEILGIGGLVGAKRTELVETLFGMRPIASGKVFVHGEEVHIKSPIHAKKHGIALLTEERRATGIFPSLSISDNTITANLRNYLTNPLGLINERKIQKDVRESIASLKIKTPSAETPIENLSGGNQQKVLLARWLLTSPEILILDEPTRGIDIGAKYEIYLLMSELVRKGKSIIMISSEMPELIGMSNRIMVMCSGHVTGTLNKEDADPKTIMHLATQFDATPREEELSANKQKLR